MTFYNYCCLEYLDYLLAAYDENPARLNPQNMHISNEDTWNIVGSLIKQEYSPSSTFVNNKLGAIQVALVVPIFPYF